MSTDELSNNKLVLSTYFIKDLSSLNNYKNEISIIKTFNLNNKVQNAYIFKLTFENTEKKFHFLHKFYSNNLVISKS